MARGPKRTTRFNAICTLRDIGWRKNLHTSYLQALKLMRIGGGAFLRFPFTFFLLLQGTERVHIHDHANLINSRGACGA